MRLLLLCSLLILSASSCYYDNEAELYPGSGQPVDCATVPARFATEVQPLISSQCATAGCHNSAGAGGLVLTTYAQISAAKDRINLRSVVQKTMPPSGPLSTTQINQLSCWITAGAPNN